MAYFPEEMPRPAPAMNDVEFWRGCEARRLLFQACAACGLLRHPPTPICSHCHSTASNWVDAPSTAEIYTFTVIHHASHPAVKEKLPYVVALLEFPGIPGVRLVSNITDVAPTEIQVGMRVDLWWDDIGEGMFLPMFRPAAKIEA